MKISFISLFTILIFLNSCDKRKEKDIFIGEKINIDVEKSISAYLDEITDTIQYISLNLPSHVYIGSIQHIKSYSDYLFIHDQFQAKTITIVDRSGKFMGQLDRKGKGPGEYIGIDAFAFDVSRNELIIYDRATSSFIFYSFPNIKHIKTLKKDRYIMNFEVLDRGHWLVISDDEKSKKEYSGIEIWDETHDVKHKPSSIGNHPASIEISYPNTITFINNKIYYAHPYVYTTLYQIDIENQMPQIRIDFGKNKIPKKYWNASEADNFETALKEGRPKAVWVHNCLLNNETLSFWLMYGNTSTKYLVIYDRKLKKEYVFSDLKIKNLETKIQHTKGVTGNYYISEIYPEDIEGLDISKNKKLSEAIAKNKDKLSPVLLLFKLKKSFDADSL